MGRHETDVKDGTFASEVLESKLPVLVDFWASWCGPCSMFAPVLSEIAEQHQGKLKVCKANIDDATDSAGKYGVMSIPTLVLFKNGKEVARSVGAVSKAAVEKLIAPHL
jgi:thioredoxin 1